MDPNETQTGTPQPAADAPPPVDTTPAPPAGPKPEDVRRAEREARKHVGALDTPEAKARKEHIHRRIEGAAQPVVDAARTYGQPLTRDTVYAMRRAGWKKFAIAVLLVCFVLLIVSLMF